jgi:hypothetical protein
MKLKKAANEVEWMNVILLHSNQRHVSATHATIFRVARTKIQPQCVGIHPQLQTYTIFA